MTTEPVEFFVSLESGYLNVPFAGERPHESILVDVPGTHYDPLGGQRALETMLETYLRVEKMGFDGTLHTEQHNGSLGMTPSSLMGAAWLAARTDRIKIGVVGPIMNSYRSPVRLAEEIAIADTLARGRLVVGLPFGLGSTYHGLGMNPATGRARQLEAQELLAKALRDPGPFAWRGRFFNHEYVNVWPRPMHDVEFQLPGGGSKETLELAARLRYAYQPHANSLEELARSLEKFRDECRRQGYEPSPRQSVAVLNVHVAETDAIAKAEIEDLTLWYMQNYVAARENDLFPPGYTSPQSIRAIRASGMFEGFPDLTYDGLVESKTIISGSPERVIEAIEELIETTGVGRVVLTFSAGEKPRWMLEKTLGIFAEQVLPHFRKNGRPLSDEEPTYGYGTSLEYAANRRTDVLPVMAEKDGYLIDVERSRFDPEGARIRPVQYAGQD
ncbi:LLM class flavin-dependent oxidoreductase [Microbacterium gorillae]|uniref:LLM class flavin-dependent oxidoreductase n=1 Tax=Microbacterium gorillae TaxID=1231063 RepID=UPI00058CB102|nr:LLM class flavin-dependent oxidoreductase [Microbacterium gorillae]